MKQITNEIALEARYQISKPMDENTSHSIGILLDYTLHQMLSCKELGLLVVLRQEVNI